MGEKVNIENIQWAGKDNLGFVISTNHLTHVHDYDLPFWISGCSEAIIPGWVDRHARATSRAAYCSRTGREIWRRKCV